MNWFEHFIEYFRKKEYYSIDYETLNTFDVAFTEPTEVDLTSIKSIIIDYPEAKITDNKKGKLNKKKALIFSDIPSLLQNIKSIILDDYRETYFEAINYNWQFNYFLSDSAGLYEDVLLIYNRIYYPDYFEKGNMIYPILAIKKKGANFYLWDLLDKT